MGSVVVLEGAGGEVQASALVTLCVVHASNKGP
jgi:hypothetical protein